MASGDRKGQPGQGSLAKAMREAQPYIDASWQLIGALGLCALAGWWLDKKFDTAPWLLLAGALLGLFAGMYSFILRVLQLAERDKKAKQRDGGSKPPGSEDP